MSTGWTSFERAALKTGLEEALNEGYPTFNFSTIVRGTNTYVLKVELPFRKGKPLRAIVKWFHNEPKSDNREPVHDSFNRLDVLYNSEERNLQSIGEMVDPGRRLIPNVYGRSHSQRMIVMEAIGSTPKKSKVLRRAQAVKYTGEQATIPHRLVPMFINAVDTLSLLVGACNAKASELNKKYDYNQDATYREERWVDSFEERLNRLYHRKHPKKDFPEGVNRALNDLHQHSTAFREPEWFYHGDFNLLQLLGEKVIDFESFGKYGSGKDFATLLVLAGLKDSSGILCSTSFQYLVDRYIVGTQFAQEAGSLQEAKKRIYTLSELTPSEVHESTLQIQDSEEQYANFQSSVFYHALNEHIRLAAAYNRMEQRGIEAIGNEKLDYKQFVDGLQVGMVHLLNFVLEKGKILDKVSDKKERREFFQGYQGLLQKLDLLG